MKPDELVKKLLEYANLDSSNLNAFSLPDHLKALGFKLEAGAANPQYILFLPLPQHQANSPNWFISVLILEAEADVAEQSAVVVECGIKYHNGYDTRDARSLRFVNVREILRLVQDLIKALNGQPKDVGSKAARAAMDASIEREGEF